MEPPREDEAAVDAAIAHMRSAARACVLQGVSLGGRLGAGLASGVPINLTRLTLLRCGLDDETVFKLAVAVRFVPGLVEINLSDNKALGDAGVEVLASALDEGGSRQTLQVVDLSSNAIGNVGARALARLFSVCPVLVRVRLGSNQIGDGGCIYLADSMTVWPHAREFLLDDNAFEAYGRACLTQAYLIAPAPLVVIYGFHFLDDLVDSLPMCFEIDPDAVRSRIFGRLHTRLKKADKLALQGLIRGWSCQQMLGLRLSPISVFAQGAQAMERHFAHLEGAQNELPRLLVGLVGAPGSGVTALTSTLLDAKHRGSLSFMGEGGIQRWERPRTSSSQPLVVLADLGSACFGAEKCGRQTLHPNAGLIILVVDLAAYRPARFGSDVAALWDWIGSASPRCRVVVVGTKADLLTSAELDWRRTQLFSSLKLHEEETRQTIRTAIAALDASQSPSTHQRMVLLQQLLSRPQLVHSAALIVSCAPRERSLCFPCLPPLKLAALNISQLDGIILQQATTAGVRLPLDAGALLDHVQALRRHESGPRVLPLASLKTWASREVNFSAFDPLAFQTGLEALCDCGEIILFDDIVCIDSQWLLDLIGELGMVAAASRGGLVGLSVIRSLDGWKDLAEDDLALLLPLLHRLGVCAFVSAHTAGAEGRRSDDDVDSSGYLFLSRLVTLPAPAPAPVQMNSDARSDVLAVRGWTFLTFVPPGLMDTLAVLFLARHSCAYASYSRQESSYEAIFPSLIGPDSLVSVNLSLQGIRLPLHLVLLVRAPKFVEAKGVLASYCGAINNYLASAWPGLEANLARWKSSLDGSGVENTGQITGVPVLGRESDDVDGLIDAKNPLKRYHRKDAGPFEPSALSQQRRSGFGVTLTVDRQRVNCRGLDTFGHVAAELSSEWRRIRHPNVLRLLGIMGPHEDFVAVVTESVELGSLRDAYMATGARMIERLAWARQVVQGMSALHTEGIVHGALQCGHVGLNSNRVVKIADVGRHHDKPADFWRFMAPEFADNPGSALSMPADVFSYGSLLYELLTRSLPFPQLHGANEEANARKYFALLKSGVRPNDSKSAAPSSSSEEEEEDEANETAMEVARRCWGAAPNARPAFASIERMARLW